MTSSALSVSDVLTGYAAGRVTAEQLVGVVAASYYGARGSGLGARERLRPLMEVIERAHPGVVALTSATDAPGFVVQLTERPFPNQYEDALRAAARAVLGDSAAIPSPQPRAPGPGLLTRIVRAIRRAFSA